MGNPIRHTTHGESLADVIERILDKGVIINADITVSLVGTELLGIKIRAAIASFETAAKWGLAFPSESRIGRVQDQQAIREAAPDERSLSQSREELQPAVPCNPLLDQIGPGTFVIKPPRTQREAMGRSPASAQSQQSPRKLPSRPPSPNETNEPGIDVPPEDRSNSS